MKIGVRLSRFLPALGLIVALGGAGLWLPGCRAQKAAELAPGKQRWVFTTDATGLFKPVVGKGGTVYVGGFNQGKDDSAVYAINSDGTKRWIFQLKKAGGEAETPLVGKDGTVYFGSLDSGQDKRTTYALTSAGVKKWEFQCEQYFDSAFALDGGDTAYIAGKNKLHAVRVK